MTGLERMEKEAADHEAKAAVLRQALAIMQDAATTHAKETLPKKLRAAVRVRAQATTNGHKPLTEWQRQVLTAVQSGSTTATDLQRTLGRSAVYLSPFVRDGLLVGTKIDGRNAHTYAVTADGAQRLAVAHDNDEPPSPDAPASPGAASHVLKKKALSGFLLRAARDEPRTVPELVKLLQDVGHPIKNGLGIVGPLARLTAMGFLKRHEQTGRYSLTPKGARYLAKLPLPPTE